MSKITQEEIERMQKDLMETPIDHKYDEECEYSDWRCLFDSALSKQITSRLAFEALKIIGKLPQGVPWIEEELKRSEE